MEYKRKVDKKRIPICNIMGVNMFDPITDYLNHILYQITKLGILILIICFLIIIIKKHFRRY